MRLVIDSNIVISAGIRDEFTARASRLLNEARLDGVEISGPHVAISEAAHVLLRLHRLRLIRAEAARASYDAVRNMTFLRSFDKPLSLEDFDLGLRHRIGGSDLFFVRFARELDCPLVTMDGPLRTNAGAIVETLDLNGALARLAAG